MRTPRPLAILTCCLALVVAGCGEKESGIGAGQDKPETATKPAPSTAGAPASQGAKTSAEAAARKKPAIKAGAGAAPRTLVVKDLIKGTGAKVTAGDTIQVNYSGVLFGSGKPFDNSFDRGQPFPFQLGTGQVIPGWDQGLEGARIGARRQLVIPADLAYGAQGQPPTIPANAALTFVIDVIAKQ